MAHSSGIKAGDVFNVTRAASVQFAGESAMIFRVIRIDPQPTYEGWIWLDGYQLDAAGSAVARRSIFVMVHGLRPVGRAPYSPGPTPAAPAATARLTSTTNQRFSGQPAAGRVSTRAWS